MNKAQQCHLACEGQITLADISYFCWSSFLFPFLGICTPVFLSLDLSVSVNDTRLAQRLERKAEQQATCRAESQAALGIRHQDLMMSLVTLTVSGCISSFVFGPWLLLLKSWLPRRGSG